MWQSERAHPVAILYHEIFIFPRPKNSLTRPGFHFSRLFLGDPAGNTDLGCLLSWPKGCKTLNAHSLSLDRRVEVHGVHDKYNVCTEIDVVD